MGLNLSLTIRQEVFSQKLEITLLSVFQLCSLGIFKQLVEDTFLKDRIESMGVDIRFKGGESRIVLSPYLYVCGWISPGQMLVHQDLGHCADPAE